MSTIRPRPSMLSQHNDLIREDIDVVAAPSSTFMEYEPATESSIETRQDFKSNRRHARSSELNQFDYEQKYPRDPYGQERAENARVWMTYLDEAESYDRDKIAGWNDTVNILLVFIGIFSAIVSTFLSQTSQNLQQNYGQISATLLYSMIQSQMALSSNGTIQSVAFSSLPNPNGTFKPPFLTIFVNALWFASLTISLCTGLVAALTKQWLNYYVAPVSGTPREKVRVRQFRFEGLEKWKVTLIIGLLPVLLHISLALFLIGLVAFVHQLNYSTAYIIAVISGLTYVLYFVTALLPIWYPQCPYATPLTNYIGLVAQIFRFRLDITVKSPPQSSISESHYRDIFIRLSLYWQHFLSTLPFRQLGHLFYLLRRSVSKKANQVRTSLKLKDVSDTDDQVGKPKNFKAWRESQLKKSIETTPFLDDKALHWLSSTSSNPSVTRIIARSLSSFISPNFPKETGLQFRLPPEVFRNPRYDDVWDEDSFQEIISTEADFLEELCYGLYLDFIFSKHSCEYTPLVRFISTGSTPVQKIIQAYYPELFNLIGVVWDGVSCAKTLLRGFRDKRFKSRLVVWLHLLDHANEDRELALQMLTSGDSADTTQLNKLFSWSMRPSWKTQKQHGLISLEDVEQLNELTFAYLFHFFLKYPCPVKDSDSFESRYLLFITIYQNLTSDEPLIEDFKREKALIQLFSAFDDLVLSNHECIRGSVITAEFSDRLQRDLLLQDWFFSGDGMSLSIQRAAVTCFETFWGYRMATIGDFSRFFSTDKEQLQFIYRWCSKGVLSKVTFIQQLFMPINLPCLYVLLLEDERQNVRPNFRNCLAHLLLSVDNLDSKPLKYWVMHDTYVIPNIMYLYKTTLPSDPLFPVFYHPSTVVETWQLLMTHPLDLEVKSGVKISAVDGISYGRSREFFNMLQSKLHLEILRRVYDLMLDTLDLYQFKVKLLERLCRSAYIFGRRTHIIGSSADFDIPAELVERLHFLSIRDMQKNFEYQFRRECNRIRSLPFSSSIVVENDDELWEEEV